MSHKILPLHIEDLAFEATGNRLIKGLSLKLEPGPLTLIIGPNGAGKSLFLRLCHGLLAPTKGRIAWQGAERAAPRKYQSFVFQHPKLLNRTTAENIEYPLKIRGLKHDLRQKRVVKALAITGLTHIANRAARLLSGGEQQKLALARAWATTPEVLFLDEPTANLDPKSTSEVEALIRTIHENGTKIIMTSHDLAQVRRLADEIIFIHQGEIIESGPVKLMLEAPKKPETAAFLKGELLV